jgi:tetratricopeptide (TPR) repeat protein
MIMSFKGISSMPAAQASGVDGSVESALQWMSFLPGEWLVIFDNADNPPPEVVVKFIPPGNRGNILITSRNQSIGLRIIPFENRIEINEMEESDAVTLLLKASFLDASAHQHLQVAKRIVTELGCIPLAVDHAGAYIQAGRCSINEYLSQFFLHHQSLMLDRIFTGASNYNQTVYGTWDLSFKEIKKRADGQSITGNAQEVKAAHAAILILQICAFYHHSNISRDIFRSAAEESRKHIMDNEVAKKLPQAITLLDHTLLGLDNDGHWDGFIFGQGMAVLLGFSLIKKGQSSEIASVHPLVHSWSREQMLKSEQQRIWQMGGIILSCAIPQSMSSEDYAMRRLLFSHIKAHQSHGSQMELIEEYYDDKWSNFGKVMEENGDWNNAEQLQWQVMDKRKKLLGADHPNTLRSMTNLADTYHSQGKWNEAEQLEVQVMDVRKKLLGADHPDTLTSMANLAVAYQDQGKWNNAEQLGVQVMDMRKKLFGVDHPNTLRSMANLAVTYYKQGKWNEAEQLGVQVIDMRKKLLGADHPDTLISMANLAVTYQNQGKWNEVEQLEVQVMDMRKKLLGENHPDTLRSMGNLAVTYYNQKKCNEAEQLGVQVMDMRKRLLGADHPDTFTSMANLAVKYQDQGKYDKAEQLEVQVMVMRKKLFGADHPDTLTSMGNLADTYHNQGKWNEAEQLEVQVMDMRKKIFGADHPDTLTSMENLANTYYKQRKWNEAEQLEVQVMNMRKKLFGVDHPDTLTSMENLASTYYKQGKWNEVKHLEVQVMDMRKKLLGANHPDILRSMRNLAVTYHTQGKSNEAEQPR